jgi:hypothetical protein
VHTAEGIRKASDLKAFFDRSTNSSAHAVADDDTLLDALVPYDRAAWTLRNGNEESDNLELCGWASWTRAEWLDNHMGMVNNAALWVRRRCQARGIPIVKLSAADVHARKPGVIGHVDYTNGTGDGTHWDPGPGFPWDVVIAKAKGSSAPEENDMNIEDLRNWKPADGTWKVGGDGTFEHWVAYVSQMVDDIPAVKASADAAKAEAAAVRKELAAVSAKVATLGEQIEFAVGESVTRYFQNNPPTVSVDPSAIAAAVVAEFKKEGN